MENTSELYKELLADYQEGKNNVKMETRVSYGPHDYPNDLLAFVFSESDLIEVKTSVRLFSGDTPAVGCCVSNEISVKALYPPAGFTHFRMGKLIPSVRLTDGTRHSEWIRKGVFYIDTRKKIGDGTGVEILQLTGYDGMLFTELEYTDIYGRTKDIDVVYACLDCMYAAGTIMQLDDRTIALMNKGFRVPSPLIGYSCREVLGYIAAMYGGCFIMSDEGKLRLVQLNSIPKRSQYLSNKAGTAITFGGVKIRV